MPDGPVSGQLREAAGRMVARAGDAARRRRGDLILELDLTEPLTEAVPAGPLAALMSRRRTSLPAVLEGLRRAGTDPGVRGVVVKLGGVRASLPPGLAQELRAAVDSFRERGKPAVAWAETFGEGGRGSLPYYLASGFDEVWLQPSGDVGLTGVAAEVPFLREALDKIGIVPQVAQRHEYKGAANTFTERGFTEPHREAIEQVVRSVTGQVVAGVADGRGMDAARVRDIVDRAPVSAPEALEAGLVDRVGYRDEVYAAVQERAGADARLHYLARYRRPRAAEVARRLTGACARIALVHVTGPIHLGRSNQQPFGRATAGSDTVAAALRAAVRAPDVKAIVLRVASPGGSHVASDAIWREVGLARRAGRPVVVSMGDVAASGGYFVSMGADAIVAQPATLTGSIGVVAGKPVVEGLAARLGLAHEGVAGGRHGLMFSPLREFTGEEWERLNAWLDRIYEDFVTKVGEGRALPTDRVEAVARGRVWTGADARERGLVDELGGLELAARRACELAGVPPSVEPELVTFPRGSVAGRLRPPRSSEDGAAGAARVHLDGWGTFADLAAGLGLPVHGPLTLPGAVSLGG